MINVDENKVTISGTKLTLMSDLTNIIRGLLDSGFTKEDVDLCVKTGSMTSEQIEEDLMKMLKDIFERITK